MSIQFDFCVNDNDNDSYKVALVAVTKYSIEHGLKKNVSMDIYIIERILTKFNELTVLHQPSTK